MHFKMNDKILFAENQKFNQWWLWLLLLSINLFMIYGFYEQVINGHRFGDKPMSNTGQTIALTATLALSVFFLIIKLQTIVKEDGIYYRFFPIHRAYRKFTWDKLKFVFVRQYSPLSEYGGWGLRFGISGTGKAVNVSGNKGLQLVFADNKKLLIGTNKPEAFIEVLSEIGQYKTPQAE